MTMKIPPPPPKDNHPVPNMPYFSPTHPISPGTALLATSNSQPSPPIPTLFQPLQIRSVQLRNRIIVAPMCQYSCAPSGLQVGCLTPYHIATLGHYALKGAALVFIEATGVQPNGRISPNCPGLWSDDQIPGVRNVADFVRAQGSIPAIQLAHAGRKASTLASPVSMLQRKASVRADASMGGWPDNVVGPTADMTWDGKPLDDPEGGFYPPRALSREELEQMPLDWAAAAQRAVQAGIQVIEIHGAHGYLIHEFLSPITNHRTDEYGGSFENRTRLLINIIKAVRDVIPETMPLFLRLSATEWLDHSPLVSQYGGTWDVESTIRLAKMLPALGIDLLDVSSGANHPDQKFSLFGSTQQIVKDYQTSIAARIRQEVHDQSGAKLLIGAVGLITEAEQARGLVDEEVVVSQPTGTETSQTQISREAQAALALTDDGTQAGQDQYKRQAMPKQAQADVILVARQFMREPEWVLKVAHELNVDVAWPIQWLRVRFPKL